MAAATRRGAAVGGGDFEAVSGLFLGAVLVLNVVEF